MVLDLTLAITVLRAYGGVQPGLLVIKVVVAANTKLTNPRPALLQAVALLSMMVYVQDAVRQTGFGV